MQKNAKKKLVKEKRLLKHLKKTFFLMPEEVLNKNQIEKQSEKGRKRYIEQKKGL